MLYSPFDESPHDVAPEALARLRETHEGWYVEYKSDLPQAKDLAKSISSFANQYGGWLFIGIQEDAETLSAASFPGIPEARVPRAIESLRNASKDLLRPPVFYEHRIFSGPAADIGLEHGQSVIAVHIPQGSDTPYVHNDGRIYRRIGDSSQPVPVTDRATFDLLAQRGERAREGLNDRVLWSPTTSKGEDEQAFVHFSIMSDPYEVMGHWFNAGFESFAAIMRGSQLPFENIFASSEGYIARQTAGNNPYNRTLTWHFSRRCHSFITVPIETLERFVDDPALDSYYTGQAFMSMLSERGLAGARVLDLNYMLGLCFGIMARHRTLAGEAEVTGPFYMKAHLENVWRVVPFVDVSGYIEHILKFGFPLVQDDAVVAPPGTSLESFVLSPDLRATPSEDEALTQDGPMALFLEILRSLGMPLEVLAESAAELGRTGERRQEFQRRRAQSSQTGARHG